jgi:predicted transposase/invertase (TIGR01784 family)
MNNLPFTDVDNLIDIRLDNVFKAVFTRDTPESKGALSSLISALIGQEVAVVTLAINEPPGQSVRDRQIRFDINCRTPDSERVNVEMSLDPDPFEPVRLEYYSGRLFAGQDIRGVDKSFNDLKQSWQIAILAKRRFLPDREFFHTFEYYDHEHRVSLGGRSRIITLELSKLEPVTEKPIELMSAAEKWGVFFEYLTDPGKRAMINEIVGEERGIAMASEVLLTISKDEIEQARLMSEYKYEVDTQSKIVGARQEGKAEGRLEVARNLITRIGLPLEQVAEATGLDLATVKTLVQG